MREREGASERAEETRPEEILMHNPNRNQLKKRLRILSLLRFFTVDRKKIHTGIGYMVEPQKN